MMMEDSRPKKKKHTIDPDGEVPPPPLPAVQDAHGTSNDDTTARRNDPTTDEEGTSNKQSSTTHLLQTPSQYYTAPPPQDSALRDFAHFATTPGLTPGTTSTSAAGSTSGFHIFSHPHPTPGYTPGILKPSTYNSTADDVAATNNSVEKSASNEDDNMASSAAAMAVVGLSTMGLVRGENALQPTPVVRRGVVDTTTTTPTQQLQQNTLNLFQPGIHYQSSQQQGMMMTVPQSEMKSAKEVMMGYAAGAEKNIVQKGKKKKKKKNDEEEEEESDKQMMTTSKPPSLQQQQQQQQQAQQTPMLSEFPFLFDGYAGWVCRHCSRYPYYYRGPNYVWKNPQPPPNYFVDHHLMFCPGLNPSVGANVELVMRSQQQAQAAQQGQGGGGGVGGQYYQVQQMTTPDGMEEGSGVEGLKRKLDPPTGRSPLPPPAGVAAALSGKKSKKKKKKSSTDDDSDYDDDELQASAPMLPATATKDQQAFWSNQWNSFQQTTPAPQLMPPGYSPPGASNYPSFLQQQPSTLKRKSSKKRGSEQQDDDVVEGRVLHQKPGKVRRPYQHKSPASIPSNDEKYSQAYNLLATKADAIPKAAESTSDIGTTLVEAEDGELLTDYFYYMMMQLVVCRFSERDKKTRGGKRDNIAIGYGGLQCIHCSANDYSRKFYWSTVDRLANSFAEIPAHILKCKSCPVEVRDALLVLKDRHSTQMSSRPRGSQKVFFRRVWRRLHSGDIDAAEKAEPSSSSSMGFDASPKLATCVNVESALKSPEIASGTAARMLKARIDVSSPTEKDRVVLALPQDKDWLSDMDCFVRNNVEIFSASENDLAIAKTDKKYPIKLGQVGLRCIHCAGSSMGARREAVMYPYSISGIYESVRDFQKLHLDSCQNLPPDLMRAMSKLTHGCSSLSSVLRRYYVQAARALGLFDSEDGGIRAGGTVIPMISSGFSTSESSRKRGSTSGDQTPTKRQKVTRTEAV